MQQVLALLSDYINIENIMNPAVALGWFFVAVLGAYLLHVFKKFREFIFKLFIMQIG